MTYFDLNPPWLKGDKYSLEEYRVIPITATDNTAHPSPQIELQRRVKADKNMHPYEDPNPTQIFKIPNPMNVSDKLELKVRDIQTAQELINVLKLAIRDGDLRLASSIDVTAYSEKDPRIEITFH